MRYENQNAGGSSGPGAIEISPRRIPVNGGAGQVPRPVGPGASPGRPSPGTVPVGPIQNAPDPGGASPGRPNPGSVPVGPFRPAPDPSGPRFAPPPGGGIQAPPQVALPPGFRAGPGRGPRPVNPGVPTSPGGWGPPGRRPNPGGWPMPQPKGPSQFDPSGGTNAGWFGGDQGTQRGPKIGRMPGYDQNLKDLYNQRQGNVRPVAAPEPMRWSGQQDDETY